MAIVDILSQFFESSFYSIYLVTLGFFLRSMFRRLPGTRNLPSQRVYQSRTSNRVMLGIGLVLCLVLTLDNLSSLVYNLYAYDMYKDLRRKRYALWIVANYISGFSLIIATALGDSVLVWRAFIVYSRSWKIIAVPLFLCIGSLVLAVVGIYYQVVLRSDTNNVSPLREIVIACWLSTVVLNICTTSLIVLRLHKISKVAQEGGAASESDVPSHQRTSEYTRVMRIIIESGLLYTIIATANGISWMTNAGARSILGAIDIQVVGIAFNLLNIRVNAVKRTVRSDQGRGSDQGARDLSTARFQRAVVTLGTDLETGRSIQDDHDTSRSDGAADVEKRD